MSSKTIAIHTALERADRAARDVAGTRARKPALQMLADFLTRQRAALSLG